MAQKAEAPYRSANSGELAPGASGRVDIKQYYSAGLRFKNIEPVPLSGFRRMAGSLDQGEARGTPAVLAVTSPTATPGPHTGTQTVWSGTISGKVMAIDMAAMDAGTASHTLFAEVFTGGVWKAFGAAQTVTVAAQARTIAVPPGQAVQATQVRLRCTFSASDSVTLGAVTVLTETAAQLNPRFTSLEHDSGDRYFAALTEDFLDIWEDDAWVAGVYLPTLTAAIVPGVTFYAENATIGIFENSLQSLRVTRAGAAAQWNRDLWPYTDIPTADLGAVYAKTNDVWDVNVSFTGTPTVYVAFTIDGEQTEGLPFVNAGGTAVSITTSDAARTASDFKAALEALPSLGTTVTVAITSPDATSRRVRITFGGNLAGREYELSAIVTNTATAAALPTHVAIGNTALEPILSVTRGWPGVAAFAQERLAYADIKAEPGAIAFSRAGEYFDLNIKASGAAAGRLDKLRAGQASERILAMTEATYYLLATDRAVHFASNRAISATEPLNFSRTATIGTVPTCEFIDLDSKLYFIGVNPKSSPPRGSQVLSISYSEIDTKYDAVPEHILATHLVEGIVRNKGQVSSSEEDASRMWLLRDDGRLVVASVIASQEVLGFHEWVVAAQGLVREIHVDAGNDVRLCVERGGRKRIERLDRSTLFQGTVTSGTDIAGVADGLGRFEGAEVWARTAAGHVLGPYCVASGKINIGEFYEGPLQVGYWQAPVFECMPRFFIARDEQILQRPGRIHAVTCNVIETTSLAIGANGGAVENVPLQKVGDPADGSPPVAKTGKFRRTGIPGSMTGTTAVITQLFPGELYVRDFTFGEVL